jgi:cell division protein FtsA
LIQAELRRSGYEDLVAAGIVLTGGTSKMEGVIELAEEIFHMPVRLGFPQNVKGLADIVANPIYSTGVGLLQYSLRQQRRGNAGVAPFENEESFFTKIKRWFQGGG